jgi:hypothetical protein
MKPYVQVCFGLAGLFTIFLPSFGLYHTISPSLPRIVFESGRLEWIA